MNVKAISDPVILAREFGYLPIDKQRVIDAIGSTDLAIIVESFEFLASPQSFLKLPDGGPRPHISRLAYLIIKCQLEQLKKVAHDSPALAAPPGVLDPLPMMQGGSGSPIVRPNGTQMTYSEAIEVGISLSASLYTLTAELAGAIKELPVYDACREVKQVMLAAIKQRDWYAKTLLLRYNFNVVTYEFEITDPTAVECSDHVAFATLFCEYSVSERTVSVIETALQESEAGKEWQSAANAYSSFLNDEVPAVRMLAFKLCGLEPDFTSVVDAMGWMESKGKSNYKEDRAIEREFEDGDTSLWRWKMMAEVKAELDAEPKSSSKCGRNPFVRFPGHMRQVLYAKFQYTGSNGGDIDSNQSDNPDPAAEFEVKASLAMAHDENCSKLTQRQIEVYQAMFVDELTREDAGKLLNTTVNNIDAHISDIRQRLRNSDHAIGIEKTGRTMKRQPRKKY